MTLHATIRPAEPTDVDGVVRVARAAWHAAYDDIIGAGTVDETVDAWYDPAALEERDVEPETRPFFVAVDADRDDVRGFAEAVPADEPGRFRLNRIYVTPSAWGAGLGTRLLDRLEAAVRARGGERLSLEVLADNEVGVAFYEARGFERVATAEDETFGVRAHQYEKSL